MTKMNPKHSGFTLIEVLVAMLLLAGGLLGFAGLQAHSLKSNQNAYQHSMATELAYDIAERMRSNRTGIATYVNVAVPDAIQQFECTPISAPADSHCSPQNMANNDLYEWGQALALNLPGAVGTIALLGDVYTVNITWDSNRDGVTEAPTDGAAYNQDSNFQVSFQ